MATAPRAGPVPRGQQSTSIFGRRPRDSGGRLEGHWPAVATIGLRVVFLSPCVWLTWPPNTHASQEPYHLPRSAWSGLASWLSIATVLPPRACRFVWGGARSLFELSLRIVSRTFNAGFACHERLGVDSAANGVSAAAPTPRRIGAGASRDLVCPSTTVLDVGHSQVSCSPSPPPAWARQRVRRHLTRPPASSTVHHGATLRRQRPSKQGWGAIGPAPADIADRFDLVLANLSAAQPSSDLALLLRVRPVGGALALSGILTGQCATSGPPSPTSPSTFHVAQIGWTTILRLRSGTSNSRPAMATATGCQAQKGITRQSSPRTLRGWPECTAGRSCGRWQSTCFGPGSS